jgi:dipeptidase E
VIGKTATRGAKVLHVESGSLDIVGLGGAGSTEAETRRLIDYVVALAGKPAPKVCFVPTAVGDDAESVLLIYRLLPDEARASYLPFFPWPPDNLRGFALEQDVIFVSGGNTANMLAIWRVHGFDQILREAWEAGIVLTGWSAGMICWFEAGVTDSFGPQLEGMRDGLGFLAGSACPHYDGEERRRPVYTKLVADGFPAGVAADDGVGIHYKGTKLAEVVSVRESAGAYRVDADGEERLPVRLLG